MVSFPIHSETTFKNILDSSLWYWNSEKSSNLILVDEFGYGLSSYNEPILEFYETLKDKVIWNKEGYAILYLV